MVVIWRFTGARTLSATAETTAHKAVAVSLLSLAVLPCKVSAIWSSGAGVRPVLGMVLTAASVLVMPPLGVAKQRLGARLGSGATAGEGVQNLLCVA